MDSPYAQEIKTAIIAIQSAAQLSQGILTSSDKGTISKDDLSPVTVADFAIQALLTSTLHAAFPNDGFVGEESADELRSNEVLRTRVWELLQTLTLRPQNQAVDVDQPKCILPTTPEEMCDLIDLCGTGVPGGLDAGRKWVFDPIDGTKTFVRGEMYAINVALLSGGQQVLSIVGCPTLSIEATAPVRNDTLDPKGEGCIVFAARGHGTWVRVLKKKGGADDHEPKRVPAHALTASKSDLRSVSCVHLLESGIDTAHEEVAARLGVSFPGCDLLGWVPRWVVLALGLANMTTWVYKTRARHGKVWDHAGAMLLFEEVGGKITDVDGRGIDLSVGRKMTSNYGFVAAPRALHADVLKTVHEVLREQGKGDLLA
ncbi:3',5'-bisphosphate nucleotidase [Pseudomassariella vexata]|uniref:3',5'-bisphosphate nucleotidase n=1 Tax=Pseudomassariella vexata TaxID=1141098 RepID=A0A1Y2EKJ2_9PEZI|nr:3',5'-bisphosphate nucleotidase [Pseudomassariella vexata]ORY72059.1 3',5'-bisphosphate nucleotidase [Pseudomassariella vexata]